MRLNEGCVVTLHTEIISLQSHHELKHLIGGQPVCLPHRWWRCRRYKWSRQSQGLAYEALTQEPGATDRALEEDVVARDSLGSVVLIL